MQEAQSALDPQGPSQPPLNDVYKTSGNPADKEPAEKREAQSNATENSGSTVDKRVPSQQSSYVKFLYLHLDQVYGHVQCKSLTLSQKHRRSNRVITSPRCTRRTSWRGGQRRDRGDHGTTQRARWAADAGVWRRASRKHGRQEARCLRRAGELHERFGQEEGRAGVSKRRDQRAKGTERGCWWYTRAEGRTSKPG